MLSRTITRTTALSAAATLLFLVGAPSAFATTSGADEHRNERAAANHDEHVASRTAGDDEPQPASNADFSGNGANDHGAYDSTRDGSPSGNGNGDGAATGQPCAGCVGNADNKNPPGQAPDGSDDNNGYECDGNSGVGRTNPAHTGCDVASDTPSTPATPVTPVLSSSNTPADSTTTAARETAVLGVSITRPPAEVLASTATAATEPAAASPASLARTGINVVTALIFGLALLLLGGFVLAGSRRTQRA